MRKQLKEEVKKKTIDPVKVYDALFHIQDMLERSQIPFFVLGTTAKHIYRGERLDGDEEVNVGVKKSELTPPQVKTLKSLIPDLDFSSQFQLSYLYNEVPVIIDVIHTDYKVLQYPDTKWFEIEFFKLPNPFEEYWQKRDFIK